MCRIFICVIAAICCVSQFALAQNHVPAINPDDLYEIRQSVEIDLPPDWMQRQVQTSPGESEPIGALKTNACPSTFNMNTPYNSNNGQRGCMFDVLAANTVTIRCFESNVYAGTTANYEIYYRAGTHVGSENNAAAWTFLGGVTGITSAGNNLPTPLPIPINITIPAGQTYSFYITNDFGGGTSYTDGTAVGNFLASDANITVYEGVGKSYPFGLTFNVRNFNGTIFYDPGTVVLAGDESLLQGEVEDSGAKLQWEIPRIEEYSELNLERSLDGFHFERLASLPLDIAGSHLDAELTQLGTAFYRLRMKGVNGAWASTEAFELQMQIPNGFVLKRQWPNPFESGFSCEINSTNSQSIRVEILDQMGKMVHSELCKLRKGEQSIEFAPQGLAKGVYLLRLHGSEGVVYRRISAQ